MEADDSLQALLSAESGAEFLAKAKGKKLEVRASQIFQDLSAGRIGRGLSAEYAIDIAAFPGSFGKTDMLYQLCAGVLASPSTSECCCILVDLDRHFNVFRFIAILAHEMELQFLQDQRALPVADSLLPAAESGFPRPRASAEESLEEQIKENLKRLVILSPLTPLDFLQCLHGMDRLIAKRDAALVCIDSFNGLLWLERDDALSMTACIRLLRSLQRKHKIHVAASRTIVSSASGTAAVANAEWLDFASCRVQLMSGSVVKVSQSSLPRSQPSIPPSSATSISALESAPVRRPLLLQDSGAARIPAHDVIARHGTYHMEETDHGPVFTAL